MAIIIIFNPERDSRFWRRLIPQHRFRVEPHIHFRRIPALLFETDIKTGHRDKLIGKFQNSIEVMEIAHLPAAIRLVAAYECAAIQEYTWGRLIGNLCTECGETISGDRLDVLPTVYNQCA